MRTESGPQRVERAIVALAERQDGVVSRAQVRELGLSDRGITGRLAVGWMIPVLHGVFASVIGLGRCAAGTTPRCSPRDHARR
jgi:hypothetical protein